VPATPAGTSVTEHEVRVAARPETVFSYFTDPAKLTRWMGVEATLDPRPGGICRIVFQPSESRRDVRPARSGVMTGEFVEVDPPRHIALTWGWEEELLAVPPQSTAVDVSFTPDGDATIVRLSHRRLPPHSVAFHRAGWDHYLRRLTAAGAGEDPGPDPWLQAAAAPSRPSA
jgi:uncharacterized protein YndB with AHSA1/START domain